MGSEEAFRVMNTSGKVASQAGRFFPNTHTGKQDRQHLQELQRVYMTERERVKGARERKSQ